MRDAFEEDIVEGLPDTYSLPSHLISGAMAGIIEHAALYPIDTIKTRMQTLQDSGRYRSLSRAFRHIIAHEGPAGLWRGLPMVVMGAGPSHALYFAAYERTKYSFIQSHPDLSTTAIDTQALPVWISAVSGMVATFFHDAFLNPFDVVKQRMQIGYASLETCVSGNAICQPATNTCASSVASSSATLNTATMKYTSLGHCIRHTLKTEGIGAFYVSLPTTLMTNIPFQMIQFTVYEQMRHLLSRLSISTTTTTNNASSPSAPDQPTNTYLPLVHILSGGLAGSTAALLTTPLDLTKTLLQTRSSSTCPKIRHASGFVAVTRVILGQIRDQASVASNGTGYKQRAGLLAAVGVLFRGARARVVGAFPASGLSWLVYEYFKWYFAPTSSSSSSTTYPSAN